MKQTLAALLLVGRLAAQDAYHNSLNTLLQNTYGLPTLQQWVLPNTEAATLSAAINYGGNTTGITPAGQSFTQGQQRVVTAGANPWDAGHLYKSTSAIAARDKCLVIMWLRSPTANASVNIFAENGTTYDKEVLSKVNLTSDWMLFAAPFESTAAYATGSLNIGLHLAYQNQTVEVGGVACLNYKNTVFFTQLPVLLNNGTYEGQAADAPWRADAAASIEQIRKANLTVQVRDAGGQPVSGAQVHVAMQQHEFKFGTAVVSNKFNGGSAYNATYEQKLLDLDGNGHGFNEVVFENDLKWPAWEQGWFSSKAELVSDVQWLHNHGISVRGHNLVWPGWQYSPSDITSSSTPAYIKTRIRSHLNDILTYPGVGEEMIDWDVLNEITGNNDYASKFAGTPGYTTGRELYAQIFKQADTLAPNSVLYLNDYVAIEQGDSPTNGIATWKSRIDELLAAGAPVEGIGFQGHFSSAPTGIPRVKEIYDDFWNTYGLEAKVTEYDIDKLVPAATQADYLRDVLTVTFAHPSQKGFLMWGFWDGAHWLGNAPIFAEDWSLKPSGEAFIDQVFNVWWTNETLTSTASGDVTLRGFRGKYTVTVTCPDGSTQTADLTLDGDKVLTINANCAVSTHSAGTPDLSLKATPNLASNIVLVTWQPGQAGVLRVLNPLGQLVWEEKVSSTLGQRTLDVSQWPVGAYTVVLEPSGRAAQTVRLQVTHL